MTAGGGLHGYGTMYFRGEKFFSASFYSWHLHHGSIRDDLYVLHKCDNRLCVNPDHLFLGTSNDNTQDMCFKRAEELLVANGRRPYKLTSRRCVIYIRESGKEVVTLLASLGFARAISAEYERVTSVFGNFRSSRILD